MAPKYTKEQVVATTLDYFSGDTLQADVFVEKYALKDTEGNYYELTPDDMHRRLAREFARIEAKYPNPLTEEEIYSYFERFRRIVPQGSVMFGAGNDFVHVSLSNCSVIGSPADTVSGIFQKARDMANLYKRRFGVGKDISTLRPEGAPVNNAALTSTGAWSYADLFSYVTRLIGQNSRRGALMLTMGVEHPDIERFTTMKIDRSKVTGANISVRAGDAFMQAVEKDTDWTLKWPVEDPNPKFTRVVKARDLFRLIAQTARDTAEPGLLFWDTIKRNLPLDFYPGFETVSTNPCLRYDTKMLTSRGILTIEEVADLPSVNLWTPNGWVSGRAWFTGEKDTVKVTLSNGQEVFTTPDHRIAVGDSWTEAQDLEGVSLHPMLGKGDWGGAGYAIDSADLIRLGFIVGDGSVRSDCRAISVNLGQDDGDVGEYFANYRMESNGRAKYIPANDYLAQLAEEFGLTSKPLPERTLPKMFWEMSPIQMRLFLRGMYSANGAVINTGRVTYKTTSKVLAQELQLALLGLGYRPYITTNAPTEVKWSNGTYESRESYDVNISGSELGKFTGEIGFIQNYKNEALTPFQKTKAGNRRPATVVSVEPWGTARVYDFHVQDSCHSGWANGLLVHNCGEIPLNGGKYGGDSCRLISIYLADFALNEFTSQATFDFDAFETTVRAAMRLSDDLVDLELEKLEKILQVADTEDEQKMFEEFIHFCKQGRRTGLGTHGLADLLARLELRYDSEEAISFVDKLYGRMKLAAYRESIELAKERGAFPMFNWELEEGCEFFKIFPAELLEEMQVHGRRNGAILTNAPTGSVSILSDNCSSGIEPVFMIEYKRRRKVPFPADYTDASGDHWQEYTVYHKNVDRYLKLGADFAGVYELEKLPDYFVTADQIDWRKRVKMQAVITRHIDHSVSSTVNLPYGTTTETVEQLYLEAYRQGCKGITIYVDGSRDAQVLSSIAEVKAEELPPSTFQMLADLYEDPEAYTINGLTFDDEEKAFVQKVIAPMLNVSTSFEGPQDNRFIERGLHTTGKMTKAAFVDSIGSERKVYIYRGWNDSGELAEVFLKDEFGGPDNAAYASAVGRLVSLLLKHKVAPGIIAEKLTGLRGDSQSFLKGIHLSVPDFLGKLILGWVDSKAASEIEAIKEHKASNPVGRDNSPLRRTKGAGKCGKCGGNLRKADGCIRCDSCGWEGCS